MYQLTIDVARAVTVTSHPDHAAAHGHLVRHVVTADYYLRTVQARPAHSAYELVVLTEDHRRPHRAGHATIDDLSADRVHPDAPPAESTPT